MISQMANREMLTLATTTLAPSDPVDSIHDRFPIPPFKQPPTREDFPQTPRRRKPRLPESTPSKPVGRDHDRLIDDFA